MELILSDNPTLAGIAEYYLNNVVKGNYADSTYSAYKTRLDNHILPGLGDMPIRELKKLDVQNLIFSFKNQEPPLSANTVRLVKSILNGVLDFAVDMEIIDRNVSDRIILPKQPKYQPRIYTDVEIQNLLEATKDTILFLPVLLAVKLGLRRSEILSLLWSDIDFTNKNITVTKTVKVRSLGTPKTLCGYRILQPPDNVMSVLKEFSCIHKTLDPVSGQAFVVAKENGSPYNYSYISRMFKKLLTENGFPAIRFHDLRHAYATHAHYNGMPVKDLSKSMGHHSAATTLDNYVHTKNPFQF